MSIQEFRKLLKHTIDEANKKKPKEVGTLAHLFIYCLKENFHYKHQDSPVVQVIHEINSAIKQYAIDDKNPLNISVSYEQEQAVVNYEKFLENRDPHKLLTDSILCWLLEGDFTDKILKLCRKRCAEKGIDVLYLMPEFSDLKFPELGFGIEVNSNWQVDQNYLSFRGRDQQIDKHLNFLSLAISQRQHYLLEGHRGVGKSLFVQKLLQTAISRWKNATDPVLRNTRFILFQQEDFIYSEEDNRSRLTRLYEYLRSHPQVIPVFDGVEGLLNPVLSIEEDFTRLFGGLLTAGGRTFVLVCRTGGTSNSNLLQHISNQTLPPLSSEVTLEIIREWIEHLLNEIPEKLDIEDSTEQFCNSLINLASERYPGRFFPEIALHLAESTINRAVSRVYYLKQEPLDKITIADLRNHVAEEQSIGVEVFGKNPDEFYQQVQAKIKQNVIAQDWAVDKVCRVLCMMAKRPPRRPPRGRFLFVGPPGVGKTHLGRQLAVHLGLGDEAFFIFNMSEYSSDSARTRFMGADPGYVGYRSTPTIYDKVRSRPSCVILLDEIDRAHASIQDILLSILEGEGRDSEGNIIYFSQVIFIMTTNQGQEQVEAAYKKAMDRQITREELSQQFSDQSLRELILQGVIDESEAEMQKFLRQEINSVKHKFDEWQSQQDSSQNSNGEYLINEYINLKNQFNRLEYVQQKTPLDRAFLDRIDFVIPFFPIEDPKYLEQILNLVLKRYQWYDCSNSIKERIIEEALAQKQSVRNLERLVMRELVQLESSS